MLAGIRIVEFAEGIAGPMAGLRLGDLGAEVVKVEAAEGDWMREAAPVQPDGMAAAFFALNRGKHGLTLGENAQASGRVMREMLRGADVFITDRSPGELAEYGLADVLGTPWAENPRLIVADVSDWGASGPWAGMPGCELAAQAFSGYTRYLGSSADDPRRLGADVGSCGAGVFTAQGVLAALLARRESGQGQRVSTSLLNALISLKSIQLAAQSDPDQYSGPRVGGPHDAPERGWTTKDDPIFFSFGGSVGAEGRPGWTQFVGEVGLEHLLEDKRLDANGRNSTGHGSLVHKMRETYEVAFANFTAEDLVGKIRKYGANAARYMRADETMVHPQTQALGLVREVEAGAGEKVAVRAFPARFSRSATRTEGVAPQLGGDPSGWAASWGLSVELLSSLRGT